MKLKILNTKNQETGKIDFKVNESLREDLFKRAIMAERSWFKQSYGASIKAGKQHTISLSKRRSVFRSTYGRGGSRTPKKVMSRRGTQLNYKGAFSPNTVGGRRAHPPKATKISIKGINNKEWMKALKIGILASFENSVVLENQKVPENYPFILDDEFSKLVKTKDMQKVLEKIGLKQEIQRCSIRKIRAGKGTMRNRRYKDKKGPLVVINEDELNFIKSLKNIKGFEIVGVNSIMVDDFSMGDKYGRATFFTKKAIESLMEDMK